MDDLSEVEGVASAIQFIGSQVGKYFGGAPAQAAATFLAGEVSFTASMTDLAVKLQKGTATSEDVAEVFSKTSSVLAGLGVMLGVANPVFLGITGAASGALFAYKNFVSEEKKQEIWEDIFKHIFENSFSKAISSGNTTINHNVSIHFSSARTRRPIDPLALDLDGDGVETLGITADKQILFDHNGDGIKAGTGWVKSDDALLVLDRNGNGSIDNGSELFGVDTLMSHGQKATTGFAALTDLDSDRNGVFNNADARYSQVQIWRDLDQDGMSDSGELQSLVDAGIASINLNSVANRRDFGNGNVQTDTASFTRMDGSTGTAANLNFANNAFYREFGDKIALTAEASGIANLGGSGLVRDLQEAASINAELIQDVNRLMGLSRVGMMSQLDQLLQDWAGTADFKTSQQRAADMGIKLLFGVSEATSAEMKAIRLIEQPGANSTQILTELGVTAERYNLIKEKVAEFGKMIGVLEAFNGQTFLDFSASGLTVNGAVFPATLPSPTNSAGNDAVAAPLVISPVVVVSALGSNQIEWLRQSYTVLKESVYDGLVAQTRLKDYLDAVNLKIDAGGISMDFTVLDARLDDIYKSDPFTAFIDCLELKKSTDMLSKMGWQGAARLSAWVSDIAAKGQLDQLRSSLATAYAGSSTGVPEIRLGTAAADTISAVKSDAILIGLSGHDSLYGNGGDDILDGGAGNDWLAGGAGSDVYLFSRGGGLDTVNNTDTMAGKTDAVQFAADIASTDVNLSRSEANLVLSIKGTTDKLTISSYFYQDAAGSFKVEEIRFADGTVWTVDAVKAMAMLPTAADDKLYGYATADTISGGDGNDRLTGYAGEDTLSGDNGNDYIYAGDGNDTLNGGEGTDYLSGENGNDVLNGGTGADTLYGDNGSDTLDGGAGNDYLIGGAGSDVYRFGRGSGQDSINNYDTTAGKTDAVQFAADIASTDVLITRSEMDLILSIQGTTDKLTISSYFSQDAAGNYKVEEIRFADGTVWTVDAVKAIAMLPTAGDDKLYGYASADTLSGGDGNDRLMGYAGDDTISGENGNDTTYAGDGNDTVTGGEGADNLSGENGNDLVIGGAGADTLYGDNGNDILDGGIGDDSLYGNAGTDILQAGAGNDYLSDTSGAALFDGGSGNDTIYGGANAEIFVGGQGNDTYTTGAGNDIVLFNKGDGQDIFAAGGTGNDTMSLGGNGLRYEDLSLAKSGTDLVLKVGATDQITFRNWYATTPTRPIATLQVVAEAMEDFDQGGSDLLKNQRVECFNFTGLVDSFDAARVANSSLSSWALTNALTNFQLDSSDTAAIGGDFAYQYGKNGTLSGMGVTPALNALSDVNLGATPQALTALSEPQSGTIRLS